MTEAVEAEVVEPEETTTRAVEPVAPTAVTVTPQVDRPDPDPYDLRRQREDRFELAHEVVEAAWR